MTLRVVRRRGGGPVRHARVPRQPGVQVAHARLVHAEDQEGRQAVGAALADIRLPRPARVGPRLLELVRQRRLLGSLNMSGKYDLAAARSFPSGVGWWMPALLPLLSVLP